MKADLLKRMFRAIAIDDSVATQKLMGAVIKAERQKGHGALADQLENIIKNYQPALTSAPALDQGTGESQNPKPKRPQDSSVGTLQPLNELPTSQRLNLPLVSATPREKLRHHMILPSEVEQRFRRVEREYVARDRLAHFGLKFQQKILLYGPPGCGKTLGAERLAWNVGLPFVKVRFDAMVSSYLGETAGNLRRVFDAASQSPCLLFLDECDAIAKTREDIQEVGEIKRVVNTFLTVLDEYDASSGLLVAATNLDKSLDPALWRRFDNVIAIPKPGAPELEAIVRQTLSAMTVGSIHWEKIVGLLHQHHFSAAQAVRVAQDAAKRAVLEREELVIQEHLEDAIADSLGPNAQCSKQLSSPTTEIR
ncbi:MAG: ATP-binding protein [Cyanobacteria bacterium P01_D01_bin.73]